MIRSTRTLIIGAAAIALIGAGCGGDSISEEGVERLIENESGEDVDIDFGDDGFSIESDGGNFSLSVDEEGNAQFESDEGSGSFEADGEGGGDISFDSDDGSGSVEIDADGGFTVTDENGEVVTGDVNVDPGDGDGGDVDFTVEGEDGDVVFQSDGGIPDQWPDDVPRPDGLDTLTGTTFTEGEETNIVVTGQSTGGADEFLDSYASALSGAGFTEVSSFEQGDQLLSITYERDTASVNATATDLGDGFQVVIALTTG